MDREHHRRASGSRIRRTHRRRARAWSSVNARDLTLDPADAFQIAHLRVKVAVDMAPLIDTMIEDHDGRLVVVADVVDCWMRLTEEVRAIYDDAGSYCGLSRFVGDYVDEIDCASLSTYPGNPDAVGF